MTDGGDDAAPYEAAADESAPVVLVVDDDPMVAATLLEMVNCAGASARHAATGGAALAILATRRFDAVLLDVRLPDMSGLEVYAQLEREDPDQAARVAFVTGGLWRGGGARLRDRLPARPQLGKPCTAAQLRAVLEELQVRLPKG